jgi:hypothetical protein
MKCRDCFFLFLLLISHSVFLHAQDAADEKGFVLVKEKDNIFIHERWITFPKSNPPIEAREVKSVFFVHAKMQDAVGLLRDESKIKEWQSHVEKFKVYPQTDSTWFEYSYHDIPWPVSDQDHFLEYKIERKNPEEVFITFESVLNPKLGAVDEDAARMRLAGSWRFEKEKDQLKITYRILSMPSSIPRIFTDPVIRSNMMSTIKSYIKILEEKK